MVSDFWDVLEDSGIIQRINAANLTIGQRVLLTRPNGAAFTGTVTLTMCDDTPGYTYGKEHE